MEVVNENPSTLCNYEVMKLLQKIRSGPKKQKGQLATITYETLRYLEATPCKTQTPESITNFMKRLESFKLHKKEKVMLLNNPPRTPLEVQLMIEESEERLSNEQEQELLQILNECFPPPEEQ